MLIAALDGLSSLNLCIQGCSFFDPKDPAVVPWVVWCSKQWQYSFLYSFTLHSLSNRLAGTLWGRKHVQWECFKTDLEIFGSGNKDNQQWRLNSTGWFQRVAASEICRSAAKTVSYTVTLALFFLFMLFTFTCAIFCNIFSGYTPSTLLLTYCLCYIYCLHTLVKYFPFLYIIVYLFIWITPDFYP